MVGQVFDLSSMTSREDCHSKNETLTLELTSLHFAQFWEDSLLSLRYTYVMTKVFCRVFLMKFFIERLFHFNSFEQLSILAE